MGVYGMLFDGVITDGIVHSINDRNAHKTIDFRSGYITQFLTGRASGMQFVV